MRQVILAIEVHGPVDNVREGLAVLAAADVLAHVFPVADADAGVAYGFENVYLILGVFFVDRFYDHANMVIVGVGGAARHPREETVGRVKEDVAGL